MQLSQVRIAHLNFVRPLHAAAVSGTRPAFGTLLLVLGMIAVMCGELAGGTPGYRALVADYGLHSSAWAWDDVPGYSRLLSYAFLHAGSLHFFWNTLLLLIVGSVVEWRLGVRWLAGLFVLGAVVAGLAHLLLFPAETRALVGASGAVSALLGAACVLAGDLGLRLRVPGTRRWFRLTVRRLLLIWLGLQILCLAPVLLAGGAAGVAYWSHIAAFASGVAGAYLARWLPAVAEPDDLAPSYSGAGD